MKTAEQLRQISDDINYDIYIDEIASKMSIQADNGLYDLYVEVNPKRVMEKCEKYLQEKGFYVKVYNDDKIHISWR